MEEEETTFSINWDAPIDAEIWQKVGQEGVYPQQIFKVTDETLSKYYKAAKALLDDKNWSDARDAYLFMSFLNPTYPSFWIGLGVAEQSQGNFKEAIAAYTSAERLDKTNPVPYANSYQCHLALKDETSADVMYEKAIEACQNNPEHEAIKNKLNEIKQHFKK